MTIIRTEAFITPSATGVLVRHEYITSDVCGLRLADHAALRRLNERCAVMTTIDVVPLPDDCMAGLGRVHDN